MKSFILLFPVYFVCTFSSPLKAQETAAALAKKQIANAEAEFAKMASEQRIAQAFYYFADSNAVIKRQNDTLIRGKENIRRFYSTAFFDSATIIWSPDFVEASVAGDLGYTYGKYLWKGKDNSGNVVEYRGVFHTVWKKNEKGEWKFVWD